MRGVPVPRKNSSQAAEQRHYVWCRLGRRGIGGNPVSNEGTPLPSLGRLARHSGPNVRLC